MKYFVYKSGVLASLVTWPVDILDWSTTAATMLPYQSHKQEFCCPFQKSSRITIGILYYRSGIKLQKSFQLHETLPRNVSDGNKDPKQQISSGHL